MSRTGLRSVRDINFSSFLHVFCEEVSAFCSRPARLAWRAMVAQMDKANRALCLAHRGPEPKPLLQIGSRLRHPEEIHAVDDNRWCRQIVTPISHEQRLKAWVVAKDRSS